MAENLIQSLKSLEISKEDVVAIRVVEKEQQLLEKLAKLQDDLVEAQKARTKADKECDVLKEKAMKSAEKSFKIGTKGDIEKLEAMGFEDVDCEISVSFDDAGQMVISYEFKSDGNRYNGITKKKVVEAPTPAQTARKTLEAAKEAVLDFEKEIVETKMELANIAREERRCRAILAVASLQETEQGKTLLAKITSNRPLLECKK